MTDAPKVYTARELNQRTAEVITEIEASGQPAFITRHGRYVAMITPLKAGQVEARVLAEMARNPVAGLDGVTEETLRSCCQTDPQGGHRGTCDHSMMRGGTWDGDLR